MAFVSEMAEAVAVVSGTLEPSLHKQLPWIQVFDTQIVEDLQDARLNCLSFCPQT